MKSVTSGRPRAVCDSHTPSADHPPAIDHQPRTPFPPNSVCGGRSTRYQGPHPTSFFQVHAYDDFCRACNRHMQTHEHKPTLEELAPPTECAGWGGWGIRRQPTSVMRCRILYTARLHERLWSAWLSTRQPPSAAR